MAPSWKCLWAALLLFAAKSPAASAAVPRLDHVVVVIMENHDYSQVRDASYTARLRASGAELTNSHAIGHPSQPNYLALWAASTLGITDNTCPPPGSPFTAENFGHACQAAGQTWRAYSENLPAAGSSVCSADGGLYARRHEPWTNFSNLNHQNERPFTDLAADISNHTLPKLAFIVPNNCDNTHDCPVATGDAWLSSHLPAVINAVGPNGIVILTWDEDSGTPGNNNHILTVLVGGRVKVGYRSTGTVNHYNLVRTICDALGLAPFANAASVAPILDVWAANTGVEPSASGVSLSSPMPNPFRRSIGMTLQLPDPMAVELSIFDVSGHAVKRVDLGVRSGTSTVEWDGRRGDGTMASPGLYFMNVKVGNSTLSRKATLIQ
jgi:hypothetical protein